MLQKLSESMPDNAMRDYYDVDKIKFDKYNEIIKRNYPKLKLRKRKMDIRIGGSVYNDLGP